MDRLFDYARHPEDDQLAALADVELRLERQQRARRAATAATALTSLACWAATAFAMSRATIAAALFAASAFATVVAYAAERRTRGRQRALLALLPAQTRRLVCAA